jgi:hypothetical protein
MADVRREKNFVVALSGQYAFAVSETPVFQRGLHDGGVVTGRKRV